MHSPQQPTQGNPARAMDANTTAAASPFISLATQCDLLYRVGTQPHRYATISEQSVYTRAAEQLRFRTPSPLSHDRIAATQQQSHHGTSLSDPGDAETTRDVSPRVCMTASPPPPFPSIRWFELAREAEERKRQQQQHSPQQQQHGQASPSPAPSQSVSSSSETPATRQLVPSGIGLAAFAFQNDFSIGPSSSTSAPPQGLSQRTDVESQGVQGDSAAVIPVASESATDASTSSSFVTVFPSPVVVRAIAQMVLTMHASTQNSAAQFALARYRGVALPTWTQTAHIDPSFSAKAEDPVVRDALVFSVLPQVVVDRLAGLQVSSAQRNASYSTPTAAVFYAVAPRLGTTASRSSPVTAGKKHQRPEALAGSVATTAALVVPGAVSCSRLSAPSPRSLHLPLTYAAVSPDTFQSLHASSSGAAKPSSAATVPQSAEDTTLYYDEAEWLTHGVWRRLFNLPTTQPTDPAAARDGVTTTSATPAGDADTAESQRGTQAAFLKTNAFLFLSFLVHQGWCLHIHSSITDVLATRLAAQPSTRESASDAGLKAMHVVCLPRLTDVRRSPQHGWASELTYRRVSVKRAADGSTLQASSTTHTARPPAAKLWVWQLTVKVLNRGAELHWYRCGHLVESAQDASSVTVREGTTHVCEEGSSPTVEDTGTLDDLLRQI